MFEEVLGSFHGSEGGWGGVEEPICSLQGGLARTAQTSAQRARTCGPDGPDMWPGRPGLGHVARTARTCGPDGPDMLL